MYKTKIRTLEEEYVSEMWCNKCGEKIDLENFPEVVCITHTWGYGSKIFGDGSEMKIDLCESCVKDICNGFKIPPTFEERWSDPDEEDLEYVED